MSGSGAAAAAAAAAAQRTAHATLVGSSHASGVASYHTIEINGQAGGQWMYSLMDSSRVSTFLIPMLLIVYGSFRSLNMEQEAREKAEKEKICGDGKDTGLCSDNSK